MPRTVLLFPGQGAQSVGMCRDLVAQSTAAFNLFQEASQILGYDLLDICLNGPAEKLNATDVSQPAIFVASLAALEAARATDPALLDNCIATAGLSLGEYTALVYAGSLSFRDGLKLVQKRGQAMQAAANATPSGMVSILAVDQSTVEEYVREARSFGKLELANYLCPGNLVVSGSLSACEAIEKLVETKGGRAIRLSVAGAFHTDIMKPADERLAEALATIDLKPARVPVWSNVDAQPHSEPDEFRDLLVRQVVNPVRWEETMRNLIASGAEKFVEIGPGRVLVGLLKRIHRKIDCHNCTA